MIGRPKHFETPVLELGLLKQQRVPIDDLERDVLYPIVHDGVLDTTR